MPARHTVGCENNHEQEISVEYGRTVRDYNCEVCGRPVEIIWRATKSEYQVRLGLVDRL